MELLSFANLDLELREGLSVIVGPNGSGKTNLGRVVRMTVEAVRAAANGDFATFDQDWSLAGRYGSPRFEARLGLVLDHDDEGAVIEDWAHAAVLSAFQVQNTQMLDELDALVPAHLHAREILTRGQLIVRRDERHSDPWFVYWQTTDPVACIDLRHNTFAAGPVDEHPARASSRSRPQDVLGTPDGPLPDVNQHTLPHWTDSYSRALTSFTLADLMRAPAPVDLIARRTGRDPELPSLRRLVARFSRLRGFAADTLTFAHVLDELLLAILVTDNRRLPVRTLIEPAELNTRPQLADGSGLAVELSQRKNGDAAGRMRFRASQELFEEVTGRRLEVWQQAGATEAEGLRVTPVVVDTPAGRHVDVALQFAGAGVEESAWLATLLTSDKDTLILDEPATNVSAVAQRRLLAAVQTSRSDRQTIVITHSADLVPVHEAADLAVVTRLTRHADTTAVHRPQLDQRDYEDLKELLRQSQLRALLFAAGVVLVEGPTEVDAFETWLSRISAPDLPTPEGSYVVFVNVGGDERFAKYARLMETMGIPYAIVADGPAFAPGKALSKLPRPAPAADDPDNELFGDAVRRWQPYRVRTLATEYGIGERKGLGEIEAFFESVDPAGWATLAREPGRKDKALLGFRFASRTPVPEAVVDLWRLLRQDLGLTHPTSQPTG
ncbi:TOPRIM nucleotidyl transferase/hydrolase domain-containing protein [Dactylosporangium sp. CS-047395]|uniref:ATP-dependent nuclease n=1 Tax=Dactylosporangium sp. CS-047395 TaxID=3239936 RepID=UPI003D917EE2